MTTVWLRGTIEWAIEGAEAHYVHHVAEALTPWLVAIAAERAIVVDTSQGLPHVSGPSAFRAPRSP